MHACVVGGDLGVCFDMLGFLVRGMGLYLGSTPYSRFDDRPLVGRIEAK